MEAPPVLPAASPSSDGISHSEMQENVLDGPRFPAKIHAIQRI
jgi:hypothetical protein